MPSPEPNPGIWERFFSFQILKAMTSSPSPTPTLVHSFSEKIKLYSASTKACALCSLAPSQAKHLCKTHSTAVWAEHGAEHPAIVKLSFCLPTVEWVFPRQPLLIPQRLAATTLPPPRQPNVTSKELRNGHLSLPRQYLRNVGRRESSQRKCPEHPSQSSNTLNHVNHRSTPPRAFHPDGLLLLKKTRARCDLSEGIQRALWTNI